MKPYEHLKAIANDIEEDISTMFWFIRQSYSYIEPKGFKEHVWFFVAIPKAYVKFAWLEFEDKYF